MDELTANDHKTLLGDLAGLWLKARLEATNLIADAEAKARAIEEDAAAAFTKAQQEAEKLLLLVRHDVSTGVVRLFHLVEVDPPQT